MSSCIFTGSFDPFTTGHMYIAKRAEKVFDKVYIAVLKNEFKATMFTMKQREEIAKAAVLILSNAEVICYDGMAVDIAKKLNVNAIIRGIRSSVDLDYEREMAFLNSKFNSDIETLFIISNCPHISSTGARQLIEYGGDLSEVLTKAQIKIINNFKITR